MIQMTPRRETRMVGKLGSVGRRPKGDSPPSKNPRGGRLDTDERGAPRVWCGSTHLLFYPQEPIVLRDSFRPCRRPGFDLAGPGGDGQIGDERVLGFARSVRDHRGVA